MSVLSDLTTLTRTAVGDTQRFARHSVAMAEYQLQQHPQPAFAVLRRLRPILLRKGVAVVTRFPDVREVLEHDREFSVSGYAPAMQAITGDFILGLDPGPRYERDVSLLRLAMRQDDVPTVRRLAADTAGELVARALPNGRLDVVRELTDHVPARVVEDYLGAPGPDRATLVRWARDLFAEIFTDLTHDRILHERAMAAAEEIRPHLDGVVSARKADRADGGDPRDDVLGRLLDQQPCGGFSDVEMRSNLIGMLVGCIPTTSKATALALDELLRRPDELAAAQRAARDRDDALLWRYLSEAMRLAPQAPGLFRRAVVDYRIAEGTSRETLVRAGTVVFAATQSAMLDGSVLDRPHEFRIDRPEHHYLHFGAGLHTCFGQHINRVQIPAVSGAVLRLDGLRRAPGAAGRLQVDGNFPTSMTVEFEAG